MTSIEKLVSISSPALASASSGDADLLKKYALGNELLRMLELKNGFYAFESALHVFPMTAQPADGGNLEDWNSESSWRRDYGDFAKGLLFFAEDIFQDQFCLSQRGVLRFEAETGSTKLLADSIEHWADIVLRDYAVETGWPLARDWQTKNGALRPGKRLMPKTPFFLGGAYSIDNLYRGDALEGMRFKADLAMQTRNLPEGSQVRLVTGKKGPN